MKSAILICFILWASPIPSPAQYTFTDLDNKAAKLKTGAVATVVIMVSPECPLCQSYSLTLNNLYATYASKGITFSGIVPGNTFTYSDISTFQSKYRISFPLLIDVKKLFTHDIKAQKTPEVFVFDKKLNLVYRGRIDNWAYELGKKRKVITEHNLRDAMDALLVGKEITIKQTEAIGCYIED